MGYSEFPHTNYEQQDMSEFIKIYKELLGNYAGTLDKITALTKRLDQYEANMDKNMIEIRDVFVPNAVNAALDIAMKPYKLEIEDIKTDIAKNDIAIIALNEYVDQTKAELLSDISTLEAQTKVLIDAITNRVNTIETTLSERISTVENDLKAEIARVENEANDKIDGYREDMLEQIAHINSRTYAEMITRDAAVLAESKRYTEARIADVEATVSAIKLALDKESIKWVWDNGCNFGGYSAYQWFMDVTITAEDWQKANFTCVDWYVRGREVFDWFDRRHFIFSPFTGKLTSPTAVLMQTIDFLKTGAITAGEYDALQLSAEEYDNKKISAFDYDWHGKDVLNVQ